MSQALRSMFKCACVARVLIASLEDTKIDTQVGVAKLSSNTASWLTLEQASGVEWQGKTGQQDEMDTVIGYFCN